MIKATISPQYEAVSIELLQSFSQFEGRVKDSNTAKWIQLVIESVINFSGLNDYIPTNKAIENVDECDLWVFNSIASIKAELMDDFILLFDKIAERKLHLSLLSYIAMLSATKMANSNTTPILRKWSMKFFNLTLARSKNNAYLASYYWKFILLTFIYFQNGKLDLSTVDYNLIRGGGFLMLTKGDFKGLKDLEQCIFKPN